MNVFNCFQAVAFYSMLPFVIVWCKGNDYNTAAAFAGVSMLIGYILLSLAVHFATDK